MRNKALPEIRFVDFTKKWDQHKIGDLAEIVRGASPRPIQDPKWFDVNSEVGWLRIADVTEQNGRIHYLKQRLSALGQEKTRVLNKPHLLLSIAATVGKPVVNYVKTGVHDGFLIFQNPVFDREFMFQWLEMFRPKWGKYGQPGSQVNLNSDLVKSQEIMVPIKEEQIKIGSFFKQLDETISLHQKELITLKQAKKGFLQKMFPKEGEFIPELRFPGFVENWKERKLGDYAEILTGGTPKTQIKEYWEPKEIPWMSSGEVNKKRLFTTDNKISITGLDNSSARWIKEHSILIALAGQGKTRGTVAINEIPLTTNQSIAAIIPQRELYHEFVYQNLGKRYDELRGMSSGDGSRGGLNKQIISDVVVLSPSTEEQIQIGNFFKQLDEVIALQEKEIDGLKQTKKAFLQKMFV